MRPKDATDELREDRLYDVRVDGAAFARSVQTAYLFLPL